MSHAGGELLGVILAGGNSRRFGKPKALARLHGRPLWRLAASRLRTVCSRVVAVANDARVASELETEVDVLPDRQVGLGPLAGVDAALALAGKEGLEGALVLAVDMPWVRREALVRLTDSWREHRRGCAVATGSPWGFEPLCAVYPVAARIPLEAALEQGAREAGAFARSLDLHVVESGLPASSFRSVNAPADLPPPAFSIVGNKKSGKTTLSVAVIAELARRGRRVMSVKHGHHFRVDTPGTDSWRHRHEGNACRVLLTGPTDFALMGDWGPGGEPSLDLLLSRYLPDAEIVVVEGHRDAPLPKIEIFRATAQPEPVLDPARARAQGAIGAVTDRPELPWSVPVHAPDAPDVAAWIADLVEGALL